MDDEIGINSVTVTGSETLADKVTANVTILGTGIKETIEETIERGIVDNGFNEFWNEYPKKCNRPDAITEWSKLSPNQQLQEQIIAILAASKGNNPQWLRDNGRFIPYPAKYLRERRWEDQQSHDNKPTSQIGDLYAYNQPPRNRREHSVHIGSAIDAILRNELELEMGSDYF